MITGQGKVSLFVKSSAIKSFRKTSIVIGFVTLACGVSLWGSNFISHFWGTLITATGFAIVLCGVALNEKWNLLAETRHADHER